MNMDNNIFPLGKYKGKTYKYILDQNDTRYFKYLIGDFRSYWTEIYSFYEYLRLNNKLVDEINILLNIKMVLDTETTGFYERDIVLQLSYIIFNPKHTLKKFDHYVKIDPKVKISNSNIHGITNKICETKGIPISDILNMFCEDLKICKALIGHNLQFDIRMLKSEFNRLSLNSDILTTKTIEDTMVLGREKYPKGTKMKLGDLHKLELNTEMENAHNALYDVIATMNVYKSLKKPKITL
jgi:DNA polymerase III epsilon subunit-like protein